MQFRYPFKKRENNEMLQEKIDDPVFREAVRLLDGGDATGLRAYAEANPEVVRQRVKVAEAGYFSKPSLLEFTAENPVRQGRLTAAVMDVARVILEAGGKADPESVDGTLGLVSSGRVARESGMQVPLIGLLCEYGGDAEAGVLPALTHGEFAAVEALLERGARVSLPVAAGTGRVAEARELLSAATGEERHQALALAAQHGHVEVVRMLLDAGEDASRYNPAGCHGDSTPLHQAVLGGHAAVVELLIDRGARMDWKDRLYGGTPLDWAIHEKRSGMETYLRGRGATTAHEGAG